MSVTAKVKMAFLWLAFAVACLLPASALTPTAPENRVWEILSIGYDAASAEATDLESRTETSTSHYDTVPVQRAAAETKSTAGERPLFGPNAEFKAAEGAGTLNTYGDALRESLGPGRLSHPEEWESTLASAKDMGVTVVPREGTMAYSPAAGTPGQLILDPDASIGALRCCFPN